MVAHESKLKRGHTLSMKYGKNAEWVGGKEGGLGERKKGDYKAPTPPTNTG